MIDVQVLFKTYNDSFTEDYFVPAVKEEESAPIQNSFGSSFDVIPSMVASILGNSEEEIAWLASNNPVKYEVLLWKAKRVLRRQKAKLRFQSRGIVIEPF